jgi:hypothetical protein
VTAFINKSEVLSADCALGVGFSYSSKLLPYALCPLRLSFLNKSTIKFTQSLQKIYLLTIKLKTYTDVNQNFKF